MIDFQTIAAFAILIAAVLFLAKKFFWKKKGGKSCGTDDECGGCH